MKEFKRIPNKPAKFSDKEKQRSEKWIKTISEVRSQIMDMAQRHYNVGTGPKIYQAGTCLRMVHLLDRAILEIDGTIGGDILYPEHVNKHLKEYHQDLNK